MLRRTCSTLPKAYDYSHRSNSLRYQAYGWSMYHPIMQNYRNNGLSTLSREYVPTSSTTNQIYMQESATPSAHFVDNDILRSMSHVDEILRAEFPQDMLHPNLVVRESEYIQPSNVNKSSFEDYLLKHPIWNDTQLNTIEISHIKPQQLADYMAYYTVLSLRCTWDLMSGYTLGRQYKLFPFTHRHWMLRVVFLETVAGVPAFVFAMVRHLKSLRAIQRDYGWINSLLAEAENERIHLLTAMKLYKPGKLMRYAVVAAQGIMCNFLFFAYLLSPRYCHSLVGYLEEQAVHTYTHLLQDIDAGHYPQFEQNASELAKSYWILGDKATWRDVFAHIRADEAHHRDVNHSLAQIAHDPKASNPFRHYPDMRKYN